jgi:hypothetical protein
MFFMGRSCPGKRCGMSARAKGNAGADGARLTDALRTIVEVLVRPELEAVQESVQGMESSVQSRMEELQSSVQAKVDGIETSVQTRVEGVEKSVEERVKELERRATDALEDAKKHAALRIDELRSKFYESEEARTGESEEFRKRLEESISTSEESIEKLKTDLSDAIASVQEQIRKDVESVRGDLSNARIELQRQLGTAEALSGVLDDMAIALAQRAGRDGSDGGSEPRGKDAKSDPPPPPPPRKRAATPRPPKAKPTKSGPKADEPSVENVIDQMLDLDAGSDADESPQP